MPLFCLQGLACDVLWCAGWSLLEQAVLHMAALTSPQRCQPAPPAASTWAPSPSTTTFCLPACEKTLRYLSYMQIYTRPNPSFLKFLITILLGPKDTRQHLQDEVPTHLKWHWFLEGKLHSIFIYKYLNIFTYFAYYIYIFTYYSHVIVNKPGKKWFKLLLKELCHVLGKPAKPHRNHTAFSGKDNWKAGIDCLDKLWSFCHSKSSRTVLTHICQA